ncbi:outer membrane protein assembly factor BamA [Candidatus Ruthturnera calyptogenae]|uniref:outer membrane protein assembly factor BamA n=1 Tax=Candidatus Ruthturnera calyptogenae TaxID=386487 RepID=UPI000464E09D|nr:outer membrane protein assembly factor BamA [Candidatus Ruthturnera calyptogenae]
MKKIITLFILVANILACSVTLAAPIKNIEILGLNVISRGTVLSYLPIEKGDNYNNQVSRQIIRALYKTNFFKDIEVSQEAQILKIKLTENPHIKYIEVINYSNKVIQEKSLNQILKTRGLSQGKIFNKRQLDKLITQLKAVYTSKGYYDVIIAKTIKIDTQNRVGIELNISEGKVAKISSMKITGNHIFDENELLNLFEIGQADFFIINYFTEKDHYSKVALDAGIESMKSFYINAGYLDFKINEVKTDLSEDKQSISINLQISEGIEYKFGTIQFTGDLLNNSIEYLRKLLSFKKGDVFERKKMMQSLQAINDIFSNQGYAFSDVKVATLENTSAHTINLSIDIAPNKKVYINRITIVGNTRTQDEVIRREINIHEGSLYSNTELNESIEKIKRLGFFSDVKMQVSKLEGFKDKINLHFSVEEIQTGIFSIGLSHSNSTGASLNLGVQERNFLGTGNTLNLSLSNSKAARDISFYFSDPYFTQDRHSISYGVFSKKLDASELKLDEYKIDENGFSLGYSVPITKKIRIGADLRASKRDINCGTTLSDDHEPIQCASEDETELKLGLNWSNNTLNDFNFPTKGQKNSLNFSLALPVADFRYYKLDASHKSYYPLKNDLILSFKGNLGFAQGYDDKELPFFKRYYGGGSSSVRGFDFNSLGIKYIGSDKVKGGELSFLTSASVISPIKFIDDNKNMRISAFVDLGSISEKASGFDLYELRLSIGVAFSWLTPIGPLGFYAAKPLIKKSGDKIKTFDFTLGTSF